MGRRLYYCDQHRFPLPAGHKFPVAKYRLLRDRLSEQGGWDLQPAPFAAPADIELAHDPAYVRAFLDGSLDPQAMRRIGFPWSEALVRRTLASVGGTLAAARDALDSGFGGTLAGGTHHAFRSHGSGFCVFNDLAVAILALRRDRLAGRAAVIDLDVHQGDGTALIFQDDPAVFTFSMHGSANFPFRKQRSRLDLDLPDGSGDSEYLDVLDRALPRVFESRPEIVLYQSGVDPLASDRLGRLSLSLHGLAERDKRVFEGCAGRGIPVAVTLGGGYSEPVERTVEAHAGTFRSAADVFQLR